MQQQFTQQHKGGFQGGYSAAKVPKTAVHHHTDGIDIECNNETRN